MTLKNVAAALLLTAALLTGCTDKLSKYERAQQQTVLIQTEDSQGSGVMFRRVNRDGDFRWFCLTARHVIDGDTNGVVLVKVIKHYNGTITGETTYHAKVIARDEPNTGQDIAVLWVVAEPEAFLSSELASRDPVPIGTELYAIGNFYGDDFPGSASTGILSQHGVHPALEGWPSGWPVVDQATLPVYPGSSGGAIFGPSGKVIGIVVGRVDSTLNVFIPVRAIEDWAKRNHVLWALRDADSEPDHQLELMHKSLY